MYGDEDEDDSLVMSSVSKSEWDRRLSEVTVPPSPVHALVMNWLVVEGQHEAAEAFERESRTQVGVPLASLTLRTRIRDAVESGDIPSAIRIANEADKSVLQQHPVLLFRLHQQAVIELIRSDKGDAALEYTQTTLVPVVQERPVLLPELEEVMGLLVYPDPVKSPARRLLDLDRRRKLASDINAAALAMQGHDREATLPRLLHALHWYQTKLEDVTRFPRVTEIGDMEFDETPTP